MEEFVDSEGRRRLCFDKFYSFVNFNAPAGNSTGHNRRRKRRWPLKSPLQKNPLQRRVLQKNPLPKKQP